MPTIKLPIALLVLLFSSLSLASMNNCPPSKPDCENTIILKSIPFMIDNIE